MEKIEDYAFKNCVMLNEADFGDNISSIGSEAFMGCTALNTVTLPASVSINEKAFKDSGLKTVCCPDNSDTALWAIYNDYTVVLSEHAVVPPLHSRLDYANSSFVLNGSGGYSVTCKYKFTELMPGEMNVKIPAYCYLVSVTVNGSQVTADGGFTVKDKLIVIPVNSVEGVVTISFKMNNQLQMPTYATVTYDQGDVTDIIGIVNEKSVCDSESGIVVSNPGVGGMTLDVTKTSANENSITYNITLKDGSGQPVRPSGKALVKIPLPAGWDKEKVKVMRKEDNGNYTDMNAEYMNGFFVFTTDHFSEYVLTTGQLSSDAVAGDVNNDKSVNDRDSISLDRYLGDWNIEISLAAADLNGDGKVNDQDSIILARTLAGWYE